MWHFVVIEIEYTDGSQLAAPTRSCWNILYKAPIEDRRLGDEDLEQIVLNACQVWLEQNKNETSKYAIMKMYIV